MTDQPTASCPIDLTPGNPNPTAQQVNGSDMYNPLLDPRTFIPPAILSGPSVLIEFCDRCRWLHRASWVSTELFLTFPTPTIKSISLMPLNSDETGGRFRVWLSLESDSDHPVLVWDRKVEGGFPELKVLKQRIRDYLNPGQSLGHSDRKH